ncbi:MAG: Zn-dependent alcohol dehydrogenase [bacterium]|nr:Zn-dependent alcohol dehydrogenase [bacterium]
MKALITRDLNQYSVEEVTIDPPKAGEVRIKMGATGVCHSDLSVINGTLPLPRPIVLGHEGAGVVAELGEGVSNVEVGDHVVLSFIPLCGTCFYCQRDQPFLCAAGAPTGRMLDGTARVHKGDEDLAVMQFLGCMAEEAIVPATAVVKIDKNVPFDKAALVGCGVMTGVGAAINTAKVTPGSTVAVFGCGGIGLSIIQGARLAGARKIIAVDLADNKLEMARKFGATDTVNGTGDALGAIREMTDGIGVDFAFEAVGVPQLMVQTNEAARRGGTAVIVGVGKLTDQVPFNALMLSMSGKTVKGSMYGDAHPHRDFPMLLDLYKNGKLNLDDMVTNTYSIDEGPQAFEDMEKGVNARGVIVY